MYTIQRKNKHIREELELLSIDGTEKMHVTVNLDIDQIAARMAKSYEMMGMLQNELKKDPKNQKTMEAFGQAVIGIFKIIFGDEQAAEILKFYENDYTEMLVDLFPFINDQIMPQVKAASRQRREQLEAAANTSRRDTLFGRFR